MSQMRVAVFSLLWFLYPQKIKMILSVCTALITINDNISCYFIIKFFLRRRGHSKLLLNCWYAALFVVLSCMCVCCVG